MTDSRREPIPKPNTIALLSLLSIMANLYAMTLIHLSEIPKECDTYFSTISGLFICWTIYEISFLVMYYLKLKNRLYFIESTLFWSLFIILSKHDNQYFTSKCQNSSTEMTSFVHLRMFSASIIVLSPAIWYLASKL